MKEAENETQSEFRGDDDVETRRRMFEQRLGEGQQRLQARLVDGVFEMRQHFRREDFITLIPFQQERQLVQYGQQDGLLPLEGEKRDGPTDELLALSDGGEGEKSEGRTLVGAGWGIENARVENLNHRVAFLV